MTEPSERLLCGGCRFGEAGAEITGLVAIKTTSPVCKFSLLKLSSTNRSVPESEC